MTFFARLITLLAFLVGGAGCLSTGSSPEALFYQLEPDGRLEPVAADAGPERVVLRPARVSSYLHSTQMARRDGEGRLRYSEIHRWAGALEENITEALYLNARAMLGDRARLWPVEGMTPETPIVEITLYRFEATPGKEARLKAGITWREDGTETVRVIDLEIPVEGDTMADAVAAQSRLLGELTRRWVGWIGE